MCCNSLLMQALLYVNCDQELQEMVLKCREDLIAARVGQEQAEATAQTQRQEAQLYLSQSEAEQQQRQQLENSLAGEINVLK